MRPMIKTRSRLWRIRGIAAHRRGKERIDLLMPEPCHPVTDHVTPHHSIDQPLLILLVNHAAVQGEVLCALPKKVWKRHLLLGTASQGMANQNLCRIVWMALNLPHPLPTVPAILLKDPR